MGSGIKTSSPIVSHLYCASLFETLLAFQIFNPHYRHSFPTFNLEFS
jgi:hypothetical protein